MAQVIEHLPSKCEDLSSNCQKEKKITYVENNSSEENYVSPSQ
jgi:hypothetical protein